MRVYWVQVEQTLGTTQTGVNIMTTIQNLVAALEINLDLDHSATHTGRLGLDGMIAIGCDEGEISMGKVVVRRVYSMDEDSALVDFIVKHDSPEWLNDNIDRVEAIEFPKYYQIIAIMNDGERVIIKNKSNKVPAAVQLYNYVINGNASSKSSGQFFTFCKKPGKDSILHMPVTVQPLPLWLSA